MAMLSAVQMLGLLALPAAAPGLAAIISAPSMGAGLLASSASSSEPSPPPAPLPGLHAAAAQCSLGGTRGA
eukprot:121639-Chlamydomonas_euryale.AAC.6